MSAASVLVVDDDPAIRLTLDDYLSNHGYHVSTADGGSAMRLSIAKAPPNIVLLDVMMPNEDGWTLMRELHTHPDIGIIMLTVRDDLPDLVRGLQGGADDYVAKPFRMKELAARIDAVLRRCSQRQCRAETGPKAWCFDGWTLDRQAWRLQDKDGLEINLTAGEFALLDMLLKQSNQTIDRASLFKATRNRSIGDTDRSIDVQISALRAKMQDSAKSPNWIKTVRGEGYCLSADVQRID